MTLFAVRWEVDPEDEVSRVTSRGQSTLTFGRFVDWTCVGVITIDLVHWCWHQTDNRNDVIEHLWLRFIDYLQITKIIEISEKFNYIACIGCTQLESQ